MLLSLSHFQDLLKKAIRVRHALGYDTSALEEGAERAAARGYDALVAVAHELLNRPKREDFPYIEPTEITAIQAECDPAREKGLIARIDRQEAAGRVSAGFLGSICGCQLGKPLEFSPTLAELREGFEAAGEWPIRDYVPLAVLESIGKRHESAPETTRANLRYAAPDDDINYTLLGMLVLEEHGLDFSQAQLKRLWLRHLPIPSTWASERSRMAAASVQFAADSKDESVEPITELLVLGDCWCGAQIRADAYGYVAPGNPELAAALAWRDASITHIGIGGYATMWTAAAIAIACVIRDPLEVIRRANQYVPGQSRFAEVARHCLGLVESARDWMDGYEKIHAAYRQYGHCMVLQETGTLMNTLRFAQDVGDGICLQVMQGNDTDSYGATAGAMLGCLFGPGHLEERWLAPINDTIHTTLADLHEQRLSALARRIAKLPELSLSAQPPG